MPQLLYRPSPHSRPRCARGPQFIENCLNPQFLCHWSDTVLNKMVTTATTTIVIIMTLYCNYLYC